MNSDDVLADLELQLRAAAERRPSPWAPVRTAVPILVAVTFVAAVLVLGLPGRADRQEPAMTGEPPSAAPVGDTRLLLRERRGLVAVVNDGARPGLAQRWADILLGLGGRTRAFTSPNPGSTDGSTVIVRRADRALGERIRAITGGQVQVSDTLGRFFGAPEEARVVLVLGRGAKDLAPVVADPPVVYVPGIHEGDAELIRKLERLRSLGVDGVEATRSVRSAGAGLRLLVTPDADPAVVRRVQLALILRAQPASARRLDRLGAPAGTQVVVVGGDRAP